MRKFVLFTTERAMSSYTTDSGLVIEDVVLGSGDTAQPGQLVTVHYTGWLTDGTSSIPARTATTRSRFPSAPAT